MTDHRACPDCGAVPKTLDARFCEFCGTERPRPEASTAVVVGPHGDLPARFAALQRHAEQPELMQHTPDASKALTKPGCALAGMVPFAVVSGIMTVAFLNTAPGPLAIVPGAMFLFGIAMVIKQMRYMKRVNSAPLERLPSLVVGERTEVTGGEHATTTYYLTLQTEDGARRELKVDGATVGRLGQGDLGLAYLKHDLLLDFVRVDV